MNEIMRYVRDRKGNKIGILIGCRRVVCDEDFDPDDQSIWIGWSRCKAGDKFDREEGLRVARLNLGQPMPHSLVETARKFRVQCFLCYNESVQEIETMQGILATLDDKPVVHPVRNSGHRLGCDYQGKSGTVGCTCHQLAVQRKQNLGVKA
jgi:hypothetical protein